MPVASIRGVASSTYLWKTNIKQGEGRSLSPRYSLATQGFRSPSLRGAAPQRPAESLKLTFANYSPDKHESSKISTDPLDKRRFLADTESSCI